jgi:hypothetical protein
MNYLTKSKSQEKAERIARRAQELANHVQSTLRSMYSELINDEDPQALLDVFGTNAAKILSDYSSMQQAVAAINPETNVLAPDADMFVADQDGTVTYTAPAVDQADSPEA